MMNSMPCWLLAVFQGGRAIFDLGGGRENHSVQSRGSSVANSLAVLGKKYLHSLFIFLGQILA